MEEKDSQLRKNMKCFFEWPHLFKKSLKGNALPPPGDSIQVDQESLLLRCGQQMHPIKQY